MESEERMKDTLVAVRFLGGGGACSLKTYHLSDNHGEQTLG